MPVRAWFRPPRQLVLLFVAVIVVPAATLAWLASRTLDQDRALERQAVQDRLDDAAIQVVADVRQRLDALVARLPILAAGPDGRLPAGAVLLTIDEGSWRVRPEHRLLHYPRVSPSAAVPASVFAAAEALEHRDRNPAAAAEAFSRLAGPGDPHLRAAALVGLARCLRKAGRADQALNAYDDLARIDARVDDVPAALLARHARVSVLVEMKRAEATTEAAALLADLHGGRWILDRASYEMYEQQTRAWLASKDAPLADPVSRALSEAVATLHREPPWNAAGMREGRHALWTDGQPLFVVWRLTPGGAIALVAPAGWLGESAELWDRLNVSIGAADPYGHVVLGNPAALPRPLVVRQPADRGLPWVLHIATANATVDAATFANRRQFVLGTVLFVAVLVFGAAVIVVRSYARDLAVRRTQADFVAAVSHEFRSPLTSMSHLIEMLESGDVTEERGRRYYGVLARETRRLRRLVENLLDFRRMEVGRVEYRRDAIDARELVSQVADDFATELVSRDRLVVTVGETAAPLLGDREALARAVWNLLDNAAKYSPPSSPIRLDLFVQDQRAEITVTDEGPGIAPDEQAVIFRPFYRGAGAAASAVKGTGIGLATVAHIARAHGGDIRVDSGPGRGSRFTLSLPLQVQASRRVETAVERSA